MKVAIIISGQFRDYRVNVVNHIKHLIEPNSADVFIYWASKNTVHTVSNKCMEHRYSITSVNNSDLFEPELRQVYGSCLKSIRLNKDEDVSSKEVGTVDFFRRMMMNQMYNIKNGYLLTKEYEKKHGFEYDLYVRIRPDSSVFPEKVVLDGADFNKNVLYSTMFLSGHKDPWYFSFANNRVFEQYCNFKYLDGVDGTRRDNNFDYPERALIKYVGRLGIPIHFLKNICRPFYGWDKSKPINDFPYRDVTQKLIDSNGRFVDAVVGVSK